jgi:RNA polymerase sigma-70 factor (ECF subfamily)
MSSYELLSDTELTLLLRKGDVAGFSEIHNRYYPILYRHAYKRLQDREEVKDILQELFSSIWHNKASFNLNTSLSAYLYTAVRNRVLNVYKHHKIKSDYITSLQSFIDQNKVPEPDENVRIKQLIELIEAEVARLPVQMRRIFEMSRNANLSHQQIADELNISPLTVRKQVNNSLKILRVKLGTHFFMLFF